MDHCNEALSSVSVDGLMPKSCCVQLSKIRVHPSFIPKRCSICQVWIRGNLRFHYSVFHFQSELLSLTENLNACPKCPYSGPRLFLHLGVVHEYYKPFLNRIFSSYVRLDKRVFEKHISSCVVLLDQNIVSSFIQSQDGMSNLSLSSVENEDFKLLISCQLCSESFSNLYLLLDHLVKELKSTFPSSELDKKDASKYSICHECKMKVPSSYLVEHHGIFHQAIIRPYVLEVNKSQKTPSTFFSRTGNSFQFACSLCNASLRSEMEALTHIMENHDPLIYTPIKCLLCDQVVYTNFIYHVMNQHFSEEILGILPSSPPYSCYACEIECNSKNELSHHLCYIHNMALNLYNNAVNSASKSKNRSTTIKFVYRCWFCEEKRLDFFTNIDDLRTHLIDQHLLNKIESYIRKMILPPDSTVCTDCSFESLDANNLVLHIANVHVKYLHQVLETLCAKEMLESIPSSDPLPSQSKIAKLSLLSASEAIFPEDHFEDNATLRSSSSSMKTSFSEAKEVEFSDASLIKNPKYLPENVTSQNVSEPLTKSLTSTDGNSVSNYNSGRRTVRKRSLEGETEEDDFIKEKRRSPSYELPDIECTLKRNRRRNSIQRVPGSKDSVLNDRNNYNERDIASKSLLSKDFKFTRSDLNKSIDMDPSCLVCDFEFTKANSLYKHLVHSHFYKDIWNRIQISKGTTTCPRCSLEYGTQESLVNHYGVLHRKVLSPYYNWILAHPEKLKKIVKSINVYDSETKTREGSSNKENKSKMVGNDFHYPVIDDTEECAKTQALIKFYLNKTSTGNRSFIQPGPCFYISKSLPHCHECEKYIRDGMDGHFVSCCQFEGFRKLSVKEGNIVPSGWLDPLLDPKAEDKSLWTPVFDHITAVPSIETCKFILKYVGSQFCELMREEVLAQKNYPSDRIWKRMQKGVREMCDVCSTTLFNTHYTCGECGILVCIDCFTMRSNGKVEYLGSNVLPKPYKSHRKILTKNRDMHMWPMCKGNIKHHERNLLCTQIICHDLMENMYETFHSVCDKFGIRTCCQESSSVPTINIKSEKTPSISSSTIIESISSIMQSPDKKYSSRAVLEDPEPEVNYKQCPICFTSFPSAVPTLGSIHLTRHFENEIRSFLGEEKTSCPKCSQTFDSEDLTILHLGIEHGITNDRLISWKRKKPTRINLKVDSASTCVVCGMNFAHHMMGFPQIRSHIFLHFRPIIRKKFSLEGYCPLCPHIDGPAGSPKSISYLTQHIGIQHRYLDICWDEHLNGKSSEEGGPSEPPEEKTNDIIEVKPSKTYTSTILAFSCEICGARFPNQDSLFKHSALIHFKEDLRCYLSTCKDCLLCFRKFTLELDSLMHIAIYHKKIEELLNDEVRILSKSNNQDVSYPFCPVCQEEGNFDLRHFSWHYSVPSHQKIILNDSKLKKIVNQLDIYCVLCDKQLRSSHFHSHYYRHFRKVFDFKLNGDMCHLCDDRPNFISIADLENHFKAEHFPKYLDEQFQSNPELCDIKKLLNIDTDSTSSSTSKRKVSCDYCTQGYYEDQYYEHMSLKHFQEALQVGLPENPPFNCDRCAFVGEDLSSLIVHSADYHKNLDRILNQICPSSNDDEERSNNVRLDLGNFKTTQRLSEKTRIFTCKKCSFITMNEAKLNAHIVQHIRNITQSFIGCKRPPYICPKCQYEAATYISLSRHFCTSHTHLLDLDKDEIPSSSSCSLSEKVSSNSSEEWVKSRFQVLVTYKENNKNELPKETTSPAKASNTQNFISFIGEIAKNKNDNISNDRPSSENHSSISRAQRFTEDMHGDSREQRVMTKGLSFKLYPEVDHDWLCDGRLLVLNDPTCSANKKLFQDQWKRGQPVLVGNCSKDLSSKFWHPKAFFNDFGHIRHDLVNCFSGKIVPKAPLSEFWNGFERVKERLRDSSGNPMLLKLKDWPPTLDIADYIPKRFQEFINSLILPEYTQREGYLNLASYIPKFFLRPELGPKMYIAYGSALYSDKGSTNLHIDMSDAVNLLVHVGIPEDADSLENAKEVFKEIDEADCDVTMKWRVRNENRLPGALWHIYHPSDTNKIRSFLNKVALAKGKRLDPHDDPIHDQSHYLDGPLRLRLYEEYGVKGYGIIQCAGDTVFIPAGACHQVRNLHNCIKIAEDFVSPENTSHCLHLTQEFRHLTDFHTNHEDKLQIKNLMYHSVKTAITVLKNHLDKDSQEEKNANQDENSQI